MTPELQKYIEEHIDAHPEALARLERATNLRLHNGRMCSGHLQGRLLRMLTEMISPRRVLELGTFSGYSALSIAEGLKDDATLDTVEVDDELEDFILEALASCEAGKRVRLHIGPALEVMKEWNPEEFDMIFIDADKREYSLYYEAALRLLRPGGFIIADNTLWDGHVIESDHARDPQTRGIREFNDLVASDQRVEKVILPVRDGLTLIRKLKPHPGR